jgi:hypothetical protein
MKYSLLIVLLAMLAGCASDDARLHGTWQSNREATVAAALLQNPSLTNLPPDRVEKFGGVYGQMTMTYSHGMVTQCFRGTTNVWPYKVVEKGADFVVVRSPMQGVPDAKMRFVESGKAYWVDGIGVYEERFDRVEAK